MLMYDLEYVKNLSYPDFVGFVNQWNVLPGAYTTLSKWISFSHINSTSKIMQFACTTGFQSREIALLTGCSGCGFDLSEEAVKMAIYNKEQFAPDIKIDYFQADGFKLNVNEKYTHVIIGAGFQFFSDPIKAIKKTLDFIDDNGYLLASPFYISEKIPDNLISEFYDVFGIYPTTKGYKDVMKMFSGLEIIYEDRNIIIPETEEELKHYCNSIINRACKLRNITDKNVIDYMYNRLYKIKEMSNKLRPFQGYSVLVLRYRKDLYPDRLIELF